MNTKFFFVLLAVLIVLIVAACAPAITGNSAPIDPIQPADNEILAPVSVSGNSATESESRLWSGEVFLSDNNQPDHLQNPQMPAKQNLERGCFSEDSQPRTQSGCVE